MPEQLQTKIAEPKVEDTDESATGSSTEQQGKRGIASSPITLHTDDGDVVFNDLDELFAKYKELEKKAREVEEVDKLKEKVEIFTRALVYGVRSPADVEAAYREIGVPEDTIREIRQYLANQGQLGQSDLTGQGQTGGYNQGARVAQEGDSQTAGNGAISVGKNNLSPELQRELSELRRQVAAASKIVAAQNQQMLMHTVENDKVVGIAWAQMSEGQRRRTLQAVQEAVANDLTSGDVLSVAALEKARTTARAFVTDILGPITPAKFAKAASAGESDDDEDLDQYYGMSMERAKKEQSDLSALSAEHRDARVEKIANLINAKLREQARQGK